MFTLKNNEDACPSVAARTLQKAPGPQYYFDVWNWAMDKQRFIILDEGPPVNQKVPD